MFVVGHRGDKTPGSLNFFICMQLRKSASKRSRVWSSSLRFCDGD